MKPGLTLFSVSALLLFVSERESSTVAALAGAFVFCIWAGYVKWWYDSGVVADGIRQSRDD
jgi:hypothetical protein